MSEKFRRIAPDYWAAGQIDAADVAEAAKAGGRLILNNRPDDEEPGQPAGAEIAAAAKAHGLDYVAIPVANVQSIADRDLDRFEAAIAGADGPVLSYCRSGMRSAALRALARARAGAAPEALIEEAGKAGYNLAGLRPRLEALARGRRG